MQLQQGKHLLNYNSQKDLPSDRTGSYNVGREGRPLTTKENMMNPVLKQRKTETVAGWLTRDMISGDVTLWEPSLDRGDIVDCCDSVWRASGVNAVRQKACELRCWDQDEFKSLYAGIPRKGRAVYVQIEIVVD